MQDLRSNRTNVPDLDKFGFRPLTNPTELPQLEQRSQKPTHSSRSKPPLSSVFSSPATPPVAAATSSVSKRSIVSQDDNEFYRDALQVHNELRRRHGVEPLRLNNELSKLAQQWGKVAVSVLQHITFLTFHFS